MQRIRSALPNGLAVVTDLYKDHLIFATLIAGALVAGGYLIPQFAGF